jgi:hypothetical protein
VAAVCCSDTLSAPDAEEREASLCVRKRSRVESMR